MEHMVSFAVSVVVGVPLFLILVRVFFKKSFLRSIMPYFVAYSLVQIFLGMLGGIVGPKIFPFTTAGTVVAGLAFFMILNWRISLPIKRAAEIAMELAEGEKDLTIRLNSKTSDELGILSHHFNSFLDRLSAIIAEIRRGVQESEEKSGALLDAMEKAMGAAEEINRISGDVKEVNMSQAAAVTEVSSTMEEIARTMKSQDDRISDQSSIVSQSSAAIEQMMANIKSIASNLQTSSREFENLHEVVRAGRTSVDDLRTMIGDLHRQSDLVMEANEIIASIASQTNLLAMNASIERSVTSSGEAETAFEGIIRSVETVTNVERQIKDSMDEQSSGSSEVLKALTSIRNITEEIHDGSREILTGTNAVSAGMVNLLGITEKVKTSSVKVTENAGAVEEDITESLMRLNESISSINKVQNQVFGFKIPL